MKKCSKCKEIKSLLEFHNRKATSGDGLQYHCRVCQLVIQRKRNACHPKKVQKERKKSHLRSSYGITLEEYQAMFDKQLNKCGICAIEHTNTTGGLFVDHNHTTGKVRGLLCKKCNTAIGLLNDDPLTIDNAKLYVELDGCY